MKLCIAQDPGIRLRDIGEQVDVTERAAHRIVADLAAAGYLSRERHGRRNRYTINSSLTLSDPVARRQRVSDLLAVLTEPHSAPPALTQRRPLGEAMTGLRCLHPKPNAQPCRREASCFRASAA